MRKKVVIIYKLSKVEESIDGKSSVLFFIKANESLQIKSQAPNGTCCKEIWQKVGRKKCSTNKPPQSAGLKREKKEVMSEGCFQDGGNGSYWLESVQRGKIISQLSIVAS